MQNTPSTHSIIAAVLSAFMLIGIVSETALGELVVFDLGLSGNGSANGQDLAGLSSGSTSASGISFTATMNAQTQTNSVFSLSNRGFGIDSVGFDRARVIDARFVPNEGLNFQFSTPAPAIITVVSLDFRGISGSGNPGQDQAMLSFTGGNSFVIDGSTVNGQDQIFVNESYNSGQIISLTHADGNGFTIQAITLDIQAIPECSSFLMFGLAMAMTCSVRRRNC